MRLNQVALTVVLAALLASGASLAEAGINVWTSNGPEGGVITALAIDPVTPTTLYAASGTYYAAATGRGVFKSTDGGGSWTRINSGLPPFLLNFDALAIDPVTPSTLYAGLWWRSALGATHKASSRALTAGRAGARRTVA